MTTLSSPSDTPAPVRSTQKLSRQSLARLALALLLLGLAWRIVRYFLRFPIWGDESLLSLNFVWFGYGELARHLENLQVAPLLFLWWERAALVWLGPDELSMRLLPFLAGTGSLALYWRLTGLMLGPKSRLFAVGFLSVAIWPVSMSTLLKPYSCDLFMSLALLLPAVHWLREPGQTRWLAVLSLIAPVALLGSYPVIFVAGGVSLALLLPVWRQGWKARVWYVIFNLLVLGSFLAACRIGANQMSTVVQGTSTETGMTNYWAEAFPPASLLAFPKWFLLLITGQMTAYPVGASKGGSTFTVICCVAGIVCWTRRRRWSWLALLVTPLFLGLAASFMHRYPFGSAGRLNQHLAPEICILAGLGLAVFIDKVAAPARNRTWVLTATAVFALIGLGGMVRDVVRPYRDAGCQWTRDMMAKVRAEVPATEPIVICNTAETMNTNFTWYWLTQKQRRITWNAEPPAAAMNDRELCGFYAGPDGEAALQRLGRELQLRDPAWHLVRREYFHFDQGKGKLNVDQCHLFFFARS